MALNPFTPAFGGKPQNFFGRESELAMVKGYPVMLIMAGLPGAKERVALFEGCYSGCA